MNKKYQPAKWSRLRFVTTTATDPSRTPAILATTEAPDSESTDSVWFTIKNNNITTELQNTKKPWLIPLEDDEGIKESTLSQEPFQIASNPPELRDLHDFANLLFGPGKYDSINELRLANRRPVSLSQNDLSELQLLTDQIRMGMNQSQVEYADYLLTAALYSRQFITPPESRMPPYEYYVPVSPTCLYVFLQGL